MSTPTPGNAYPIGPAEVFVPSTGEFVTVDAPAWSDSSFVCMDQLASTKSKRGFLPMSATTIRKLLKAGKFPAPFRVFGSRKKLWRRADIEAWIDSLPRK